MFYSLLRADGTLPGYRLFHPMLPPLGGLAGGGTSLLIVRGGICGAGSTDPNTLLGSFARCGG